MPPAILSSSTFFCPNQPVATSLILAGQLSNLLSGLPSITKRVAFQT